MLSLDDGIVALCHGDFVGSYLRHLLDDSVRQLIATVGDQSRWSLVDESKGCTDVLLGSTTRRAPILDFERSWDLCGRRHHPCVSSLEGGYGARGRIWCEFVSGRFGRLSHVSIEGLFTSLQIKAL